jgi:hypothetical protein
MNPGAACPVCRLRRWTMQQCSSCRWPKVKTSSFPPFQTMEQPNFLQSWSPAASSCPTCINAPQNFTASCLVCLFFVFQNLSLSTTGSNANRCWSWVKKKNKFAPPARFHLKVAGRGTGSVCMLTLFFCNTLWGKCLLNALHCIAPCSYWGAWYVHMYAFKCIVLQITCFANHLQMTASGKYL